jgi:hypothetical protein
VTLIASAKPFLPHIHGRSTRRQRLWGHLRISPLNLRGSRS